MEKSKNNRIIGRARTVLLAGLVISALAASPALAKGPPSRGGTGNEYCWVTPNPAKIGYTYSVWGAGFQSGMLVDAFVSNSGGTNVLMGQAGQDGVFSTSSLAVAAGTNNVDIYQVGDRHMRVLAHCSFEAN